MGEVACVEIDSVTLPVAAADNDADDAEIVGEFFICWI
jgi:hypothetical protein